MLSTPLFAFLALAFAFAGLYGALWTWGGQR